jgi:NAD(P)-dependent dehydrogenase (short-subunit alcohol dehydrogenase family)
MGIERKVAVITGGIGAALVKAYRDRNYRVVATARSVKPLSDADVLLAPGDIEQVLSAPRSP